MRICYGLAVLLLAGACAQGTVAGDDDGDDPRPDSEVAAIDGPPSVDGPPVDGPPIDGPPIDGPPIDGPPIDAPPPIDAAPPDAGCTTQAVQLLGNPNLDDATAAPWQQSLIDGYTVIGADIPGTGPHTLPNGAWMGGFLSSTDYLYQDVAIPAGATGVSLNGFRWFATEETGGVYDTVRIEIRSTAGAVLETLASWSNSDQTAAWTAFSLGVTGNYGGQTVRVYLTSTTDSSLNTNFFFDSLGLNATVCQ